MFRSLPFALLLVASAPAQTIVSGGGTALQLAVDAATPGDTLVVRPATYSSLNTSKGVTIVCDPGVVLSVFSSSVVEVSNVPAGQTFVLRGCTIQPAHPLTLSAIVSGCAGAVVFEDIDGTNFSVFGSDQVAFHRVDHAVDGNGSTVSVVDCDARVNLVNSEVSVSGGTIPQLTIAGSNSRITGCAVTGFASIDGGTHVIDPDTTFAIGPSVSGGAIVTSAHVPEVAADALAAGTNATMSTTIGPGQFGALAIGFPSPPVPTPFGAFWGGPFMLTVASGFAPASGVLATTFPVPSGWQRGEKFVLHGVLAEADGTVRLSPALLTVVP